MAASDHLQVRPIPLPRGGKLVTVQDAADHIETLPEATRRNPLWLRAIMDLTKAAEHGGPWLFLARIAIYKAIYGDQDQRKFDNPKRKPQRWGKRKLKRDA